MCQEDLNATTASPQALVEGDWQDTGASVAQSELHCWGRSWLLVWFSVFLKKIKL